MASVCVECGVNFVRPPESPPVASARCNWCEITFLRSEATNLKSAVRKAIGHLSTGAPTTMCVALARAGLRAALYPQETK